MNIELKTEHEILSLTNEENDNDNYLTIRFVDKVACEELTMDVDILELYSAVLSFITLKKKNEEKEEHYARTK